MFFFVLSCLLIALFAFVDVWYFVRGIKFGVELLSKQRKRSSKDEILSVSRANGMVLPSDIDMWWHMNNSKYLREMDFGRIKFFSDKDVRTILSRLKGRLALSAISIRYRRSLLLWQRFTIETKILCWKNDGFYLEQRFVGDSDKFIYAIALVKMVVRGEGVNMDVVMENIVGESFLSPPLPPEVKCWMNSIAESSEGLKKERTR
ncbi:protein THEM6-like [Halichondria panicea]|uniref:protein THEM6-like n=1 Tax=Halichondria panicea TaxID=6063 RepID=UPI00312B426B